MLHKTRAIALSRMPYKEHTLIARAYTERFGLQSYLVNGVRKARASRHSAALFEPLQVLELVVYHKPTRQIQRIGEAKLAKPYQSLSHDIDKQKYVLIIAELLLYMTEAYDEGRPYDSRFHFICESLYAFDHLKRHYPTFFFQFCVKMGDHLGLGLDDEQKLIQRLDGLRRMHTKEIAHSLISAYQHSYQNPPKLHPQHMRDALSFLLDEYASHYTRIKRVAQSQYLRELLALDTHLS